MTKDEAYTIVKATGLRNPFRGRVMRQSWDACVFQHEIKHRNLFLPDGTRRKVGSYGSSLASSFWQGYDNVNAHRYDRASKATLGYAMWRAGRDVARKNKTQQSAA